MIEQLIAEATECDFKVALETKKPKSWLKSVSAFSNGIGGTLFFGISDDREPIGLSDVQKDAEAISRLIKERITPLPQFILKPLQEDGKNLLALEVSPGRSTPYYYKADGVMEAYIRVGNESVIAPDYIVNELILKGTNQSFDTLTTEAVKKDYSFTLLEATYLERTGLRFEPSDYVSFGLADKNGVLTNAGKLMTDQHTVYKPALFNARLIRLIRLFTCQPPFPHSCMYIKHAIKIVVVHFCIREIHVRIPLFQYLRNGIPVLDHLVNE